MQRTGQIINKERFSNLELFRIIVMLLIVAHHYVVNSGLMPLMNETAFTGNSLFLRLFGAWGKIGINCFVLITGYFMCTSAITFKKFSKLVFEVQLYKAVLYIVFLVLGKAEISLRRLVLVVCPITNINSYNFVNCFLMFYLFIPFVNLLIRKINQKQHLLLTLLGLFLYTVLGSIPTFDVTMSYVSWFTVLYLVASYIRLYPRAIYDSVRFWGVVTAVCVVLCVVSVVAMTWLGELLGLSGAGYYFIADSNKILAFATGLSSFMFFKNIKLRNSRFINLVGGSTFGVLLVHTTSAVSGWLWNEILKNTSMFKSPLLVVHAVGSVLAIFVVGIVIDVLRIKYIERPFFAIWDKWYYRFLPWYKSKEEKVLALLQIKE